MSSGVIWSSGSSLSRATFPRWATILVVTHGGYKLVPFSSIKVESDGTAYIPGPSIDDWDFILGYSVVDMGITGR